MFASQTIGTGYNTAIDGRDLSFSYTTAGDQEFTGVVRYVAGTGSGASPVPEPRTGAILLAGMVAMLKSLRMYLGNGRTPIQLNVRDCADPSRKNVMQHFAIDIR
jgi:hypothetical protein